MTTRSVASATTCNPREYALIVDWNEDRSAALAQALAKVGLYAICSRSPQNLPSERCAVVLTPDEWPSLDGAGDCVGAMAVVAAARSARQSARILVFPSTSRSLDVFSRCRYLAAGVHVLADTACPEPLAQYALQVSAGGLEAQSLDGIAARLGIVGQSRQLRDLIEMVSKAAQLSSLTVLITGPTGTGKQLFAQAVHQLDERRSRQAFVAVNCAAIAPSLAESELFGHDRGAYPGRQTAAWDFSAQPTAERFSWTRSANSISRSNPNFCAPWRNAGFVR